jgi:hypothetical protein
MLSKLSIYKTIGIYKLVPLCQPLCYKYFTHGFHTSLKCFRKGRCSYLHYFVEIFSKALILCLNPSSSLPWHDHLWALVQQFILICLYWFLLGHVGWVDLVCFCLILIELTNCVHLGSISGHIAPPTKSFLYYYTCKLFSWVFFYFQGKQ